MIRRCRQKKIDLVLLKSISRSARNTVDCLNYIRALRTLGIVVIFGVVKQIYDSFLSGHSIRMIKKKLEEQGILTAKGGTVWSEAAIRSTSAAS